MTRRGLLLASVAMIAWPAMAASRSETAKMALVPFANSPFPYDGMVPIKDVPFLDDQDGTRRGHISPRAGKTYWEDETYSDRRSLIYIPADFDPGQPGVIVVFLHGNAATLERDVVARQRVPEQVAASGLNAVLLAPQFAVDALDSSSGHFWTPGFFARYLDEAATKIAETYGKPSLRDTFAKMPVIIVAYSGGYNPAAYAVGVGGADERIMGLILLDALYAEEERIADWIAANKSHAFLFSAYTKSSAANNDLLGAMLRERDVPYGLKMPNHLAPGSVTLFATNPDLDHNDFVTRAWVRDPIAWLLRKVSS